MLLKGLFKPLINDLIIDLKADKLKNEQIMDIEKVCSEILLD